MYTPLDLYFLTRLVALWGSGENCFQAQVCLLRTHHAVGQSKASIYDFGGIFTSVLVSQ